MLLTNKQAAAEEIIAASELAEIASGVYFLIGDDKILYVGQSKNVYCRLGGHFAEGRIPFTRWSIIRVDADWLNEAESHYIDLFQPEYNRCRGPIGKVKHNQEDLQRAMDRL